MQADREIIRRYIAGTVRAIDGRGRHANERACYEALLQNTTPTIARLTAQAARAVGECIANASNLQALDAGQFSWGKAAQAPNHGSPGPGAAPTPSKGWHPAVGEAIAHQAAR